MAARLVDRERLDDPLLQLVGRAKLALLRAPAGYGKTAALLQLLSHMPSGHPVAWINASDHDDLPRLVACLLAALSPHRLPWRVRPQDLPQLALEPGALRSVVEEIAAALEGLHGPAGLVVIDDLHRVADPRVFRFIDLLLGRLPARWTVAITCRTQLALPSAAMVHEGSAVEFREPELRFCREEALALSRIAPSRCPPGVLEEWLHRTGGWPVAMVAGLLSARDAMASAASRMQVQRHMFDYLAEEVMEPLPSDMQVFLMQCSVLPRWSADRCERLTGDARSPRWLKELQRRSLFISSLDGDGGSLCLHELFREFLQSRLTSERPGELESLLRLAADLEAELVSRVDFLVRGGDIEAALAQARRAALPLLQAREIDSLRGLLARFPETLRRQSPTLCFLGGLASWTNWSFGSAAPSMLLAAEAFDRAGQPKEGTQARALASAALVQTGRVAEARAVLAAAKPQSSCEPSVRLLVHVAGFVLSCQDGPAGRPEQELAAIVDLLHEAPQARAWMDVVHTLHLYAGRGGLAPQLQRLQQWVASRGEEAPAFTRAWACMLQAWLQLWQGQLRDARASAVRARLQIHGDRHAAPVRVPMAMFEAFERYLAGRSCASVALLEELREAADRSSEQRCALLFEYLAGAFASASGDTQRAVLALRWIRERSHLGDWPYLQVAVRALQAELDLQGGCASKALHEFRSLAGPAAEVDWGGLQLRVHAGWACAELQTANAGAAWQVLAPVLSSAREGSQTLGLLLCGPSLLAKLANGAWPADACQADLEWLKQCARSARRLLGRPRPYAADEHPLAAYGLSARELEVLRRVAQGDNNKQIAATLMLSPHTVKRHVANILERIDCPSRHAAAAWYLRHMQ